jgi:predicted kinase
MNVLIAFGGLPGAGKSTLAAQVAGELRAIHLRIDTIEQSMRRSGLALSGPEGYLLACCLAEDNLRLGHTVIVDCVNPIEVTRDYWRNAGKRTSRQLVEIEVICSDVAEHRRRVESRVADIADLVLPSWQQVLDRDYEPWEDAIVIDTCGQTPRQSATALKDKLMEVVPCSSQ